jgi:predicted DNA-binding transcriptional regulator YafY
MKYANRPALVRLAVIDQQLRSGRWPNASSLARDLEVTARTVHRDFDFLRENFDAPLTFDPQHNGYFYSDPDFRLPYLSVSEGEYLALFLAERLVQENRNTPYVEDLHRLFDKITRLLIDPITIDLRHIAGSFSFHHTAFTADTLETMQRLHGAIQRRQRLEIAYQSMTRKEALCRLVDPYHLASLDGDWYLIAYCHRRRAVLMFVPSRIRELHETETTFELPDDFDVSDYLKGAFRKVRGDGALQTVRLRFAPTAARYVRERVWHPTQELQEHADGSLTLTFRVDHLLEVKRWALSFGAECEVMAPALLRDELGKDVRAMMELINRNLTHTGRGERNAY